MHTCMIYFINDPKTMNRIAEQNTIQHYCISLHIILFISNKLGIFYNTGYVILVNVFLQTQYLLQYLC